MSEELFEQENEDTVGRQSQTRGPVVFVNGAKEDLAHIEKMLMSYAHFQNLHILVHAEIQKNIANQELSEEQQFVFKTAQKFFADPTAIRSLFQKQNDESRLKRAETKLRNEEKALENDPVALAGMLAKRLEKHKKFDKKPKLSSREKSNFLLVNLSHMQFFLDLLEVGKALKPHVIRNLAKSLETARNNGFEKFKKTGKLHLPKTQPLSRISNYFVDLCECSSTRKSDTEFTVNLDKKSRKIRVGLDFCGKEDGLRAGKITKIGVIHGKIAVVIMYKKTKKNKYIKNNLPEKWAGLDLGLKTAASLFIDDETTPSVLLKAAHLVQYNAKFNEFNARINGQLTETLQLMAKMRKASMEGTYLSHAILMETSEEYRVLDRKKKKLLMRQRPRLLKRRAFMSDQLHKLAMRTLEYLYKNDVTNLAVSTNLGDMKNSGVGGNRNHNRRFIGLPIVRLVEYIKLNGWLFDITVKDIDEAYTSKTSCFHGDVVKIQREYHEENQRIRADFAAAKEAAKAANADLKAGEEKKIVDFDSFKKAMKKPCGTALGGRRERGKYTKLEIKTYWHADINGAVNHVRIAGKEIEWTPLKSAKVFSPIIVQAKRGFKKAGGEMLETNVIDTKNGIGSLLETVLFQPIATGRLKKTSTLCRVENV